MKDRHQRYGDRLKVFWQLANARSLTPTSGDQITEINSMLAVSRFATIKYGGPPRGCDIYYVRANTEVARKVHDGKLIYFASPYDRLTFKRADYISTFTRPWTVGLKRGDKIGGLPGVKIPNAITIHQTINPRFSPLQGHKRTKEIRKKMGGSFVIGHFGAVRKSCYPYTFLTMVRDFQQCYPEVSVIFGGGNPRFRGIKLMDFSYRDMPFAISACDLILYNMWTVDAHIAGSMKILEAMACGVPVLCPRLDARVDEFGNDYPLFYRWERTPNGMYSTSIQDEMRDLLEFCINEPEKLKTIGKTCINRSKYYSVEQSSVRLKQMFTKIMES